MTQDMQGMQHEALNDLTCVVNRLAERSAENMPTYITKKGSTSQRKYQVIGTSRCNVSMVPSPTT